LRLAGEMLGPFPFRQQLPGEGIAVGIAFRIESCAGIAIPVPGAADLGAGLEHAHLQAQFAQPQELVHARQAAADDDGVEIEVRSSVLRNLALDLAWRSRHLKSLPDIVAWT